MRIIYKNKQTDHKLIVSEILWFVAIALPITYMIGIYIWNKGGLAHPFSMATMYVPALTVIGLYIFKFKKPIFKKGDLGINFKGLKYWIIAPLLLSALSMLTFGISYLFKPELFDSAENITKGLIDQGFYFGNIYIGLLVIFLLNGLVGSIMNIPMFIGEELAWRAFLVPRLLKLMAPSKAFLTGAVVWGLWHAIMIAEGLNYPSIHPVLGVLLMILFCFPVGIILQYLYKKSKSVFVAALAHAALNKSVMTMSFLLADDSYNTLLYGPTGIIGIVVFGIIAFYLFNKVNWKNEEEG